MKILTFICFLLVFEMTTHAQIGRPILERERQNVNLTLSNTNNFLNQFNLDDTWFGIISLKPFTIDEVGGWNNFISSVKSDPYITFQYADKDKSWLYNGVYHRYQQYYKGILVEGGGFKVFTNTDDINSVPGPPCPGCPLVHPCDVIGMISPNIFENINISVNPSVNQSTIPNILNIAPNDLVNYEMQIISSDGTESDYRLIYVVNYKDPLGEDFNAKIDANTGEILQNIPSKIFKNAPIGGFACANLNDSNLGNETRLRNSRIKVVDLDIADNLVAWEDADVPTSPKDRGWNCFTPLCVKTELFCDDADLRAFELFYNADLVVEYLAQNYDINFTNCNLAFNLKTNGSYVHTASGTPAGINGSFLKFGVNSSTNVGYTNLEIVAHELAHVVLLQYLNWNSTDPASLHEGLADIFSIFLQYKINGPWGYNWQMGDGVFESNIVRNLANTPFNCVKNFTIYDDRHERGQALGHWYYLLVNGSPANNILPISQDALFELILETLKGMGNQSPNWQDLMRATLSTAAKKYGTCSNQYKSIARAWEKICVPTGVPSATNINAPCTSIVGDYWVCEEDDQLKVCIETNSGLNLSHGHWTILGNYGTSFKTLHGMIGNSQYGGMCLDVYDIPKFPYYPQNIIIEYYHSGIGKTLKTSVQVYDCNHDDPTCKEYFGQAKSGNTSTQFKNVSLSEKDVESRNSEIDEDLKLVVFDLMGNVINISSEELFGTLNYRPQILVYTYWDAAGKLIKSKKVLRQ